MNNGKKAIIEPTYPTTILFLIFLNTTPETNPATIGAMKYKMKYRPILRNATVAITATSLIVSTLMMDCSCVFRQTPHLNSNTFEI